MSKAISLENLSRFKSNYDTYVAGLISSAIAGVYKIRGSKTVAQLNALTGQQDGDVYNVSDSGTLTSGNVSVVAGDNVVWVTEGSSSHWDKFAGLVDLSGYLPLSAGGTKPLTGTLYVKGDTTNVMPSISTLSNSLVLGSADSIFLAATATNSFIELQAGAIKFKKTLATVATSIIPRNGIPGGGVTHNSINLPDENGTFALREDLSAQKIATYLGYTPYNGSTNPNGYITGITSQMITNALGYTPYSDANPNGYITGITAAMINTALGADALTQNSFASNSDIDALFA